MALGARLYGTQDIRLDSFEPPQPKTGQVRVRVARAGICGSDIHYYLNGRAGRFIPKAPFILGHEFAGTIDAVGPSVAPSILGGRVAVDPSMPCGLCENCRGGRYNLCESMRYFGSASCDPHVDGGFAEYVVVPGANCHPIGASLSWGEAAMAEPLSVAVHAVTRAGSVAGRTALVCGGGTIGQLVVLVLRAFGARTVALSDVASYPRDVARAGGADVAFDATDPALVADAVAASGGGFDLVFEASGAGAALEQALAVARRGGTIVQIGTLPASVTLPLNDLMARELKLVGSFRFANVFATALDLFESGRIDVKPLITDVFPLTEVEQAMQLAASKAAKIKVHLVP